MRPASACTTGPPHTPTPVFSSAFKKLKSTEYTVCSVTGALLGKPEGRRQLFINLQADRIGQRPPAAVALVGELDGRLQHRAAGSVHIKLAARKPPQVGGIGGVEQQQGRLPGLRVEVQQHPPRLFLEAKLEPGLPRNVLDELAVEFEQQQFMRPRLQDLHSPLF